MQAGTDPENVHRVPHSGRSLRRRERGRSARQIHPCSSLGPQQRVPVGEERFPWQLRVGSGCDCGSPRWGFCFEGEGTPCEGPGSWRAPVRGSAC